ncbi:DUF4158 domain-containing protein [Streptomyces sp. NPDC001450]
MRETSPAAVPDSSPGPSCSIRPRAAGRWPPGARNGIGWAVHLGTIRHLGTFLRNPEEVPGVVVAYVAEQLGPGSATNALPGSWASSPRASA